MKLYSSKTLYTKISSGQGLAHRLVICQHLLQWTKEPLRVFKKTKLRWDFRGCVEQWTAQGHCRCGPRFGSSLRGQLSGLGKTLCLQNEMNYYDIARRLWGLHVQVNIDIFSYYLSLLTAFYWVGRKVSSNFSKRCYGKTQMNFLVNLIYIYL